MMKRPYLLAIVAVLAVFVFAAITLFFYALRPANAESSSTVVFEVTPGEGFRVVAGNLYASRLIRSAQAFDLFALAGGKALSLKPGLYRLSASMSAGEILGVLSSPSATETTVTIPEGTNLYAIDGILSRALVIHPGDLIGFHADGNLEGKLFPDTYQFYTDTTASSVVQELMDNFDAKALPVLNADPANAERNLILASILEKEVPDPKDQAVVAGILLKRMAAKMPLDVDATICYAKLLAHPTSTASCYPLTALDFKLDSPYNTYLYRGLPPGPIGNPGLSAIAAAMHPESSPYWYYLSDPKTGKTIFAKTLDEQNQNRVKYLESD